MDITEFLEKLDGLKQENESFKNLIKDVIRKVYSDGFRDGFKKANKMHVELLRIMTSTLGIKKETTHTLPSD